MFTISFPTASVPQLPQGVSCRVNGRETVVRLEGEYLCYHDGDLENRRKIIDIATSLDLTTFNCASHGMEEFTHSVIKVELK